MDQDQTQEITEVSTAVEPQQPEATPEQDNIPEGADLSVAPEEPAEPEWQPDFKYKYGDEELELEEQYRQYIKDQESERILKEWAMATRQLPELESQLEQLSSYKQQYDPIHSQMMELADVYERGDLDTFFNKMGVDYKTIENYVAEKLRYQQLPEEQKRAYDEQRQQRSEVFEAQKRNQMLESQLYEVNVQRLGFELDKTLESSEVQQLSSVYDDIYGEGSFRNEVVQAGKAIHAMYGRDLPASQVVDMVAQRVRPIVNRIQSSGGQAQQEQVNAPRVIKNVRGSSASPDKARPRSVEDLRKLAAEM